MKLTVGFSPCPNDTFIFHAMLHNLVDTEGLIFEPFIADVEELNKRAFNRNLDITKLSYFAFAHLIEFYVLLNSGSALGNNCGPLLINKSGSISDLEEIKVAIPGCYTTANFLLSLYKPEIKNKTEMIFSEIEDEVISEKVDAGLIIHENRFTYSKKGLQKIVDLGEWWENEFKLPIPLGGIVVNRRINKNIQHKIDRVLKRSVQYAIKNPKMSKDFVKKYSQEMTDDVINAHINLYVNNYTIHLGETGKNAVKFLIRKAIERSLINKYREDLFIEESSEFSVSLHT